LFDLVTLLAIALASVQKFRELLSAVEHASADTKETYAPGFTGTE
jgi:hypothetical protein